MYSALSPPSIPRRAALEQDTEQCPAPWAPQHKWLPNSPGVCSQCVCVHCCVCALRWVNAEHEFPVWVIILGCMSPHFHFHFHYCCSSMLHLSETHQFLQSSSFWEVRCALIGQISGALWLAEYLKREMDMLRLIQYCDTVYWCDDTKTIKPL